jgi:two-component system, sensor histidine kinase and response regulator
MDIHMPGMDGLAATREIRSLEQGGPRVPIYALTASALANEVERCLESGMDGFLSKPLEPAKLRDVLDRLGFGERASPNAATTAIHAPFGNPLPAVDLSLLREVAEGDTVFAADLARTFATSAESIMQELLVAHSADDRDHIAALSHKLKGSSLSIGAREIARRSADLEREARGCEEPTLDEMLTQLRAAVEEGTRYIRANAS